MPPKPPLRLQQIDKRKTMNCESCRFGHKTNLYREAQCRRHAPGIEDRGPTTFPRYVPQWPLVSLEHWCGDHSPRDIPHRPQEEK